MGGNERFPEAGCAMTHAQFRKRLERLERPHPSLKIVQMLLLGEGDEEPPHDPNVEVIRITLDDPSEQGETAGI